jgi:hypothetical protein
VNLVSIPLVGIGVPVALVGGILAAWAIQKRLDSKRTDELKTEAQRFGFNFEGEDWTDRRLAPRLETALFSKGRRPRFNNIMTGSRDGLKVSMFDYSFTEGGGRNARKRTQTIGAFSKTGAGLPYFEMRPSGMFDKIADVLFHRNIHFESRPEFSRRFVLRGALKNRIYLLFTPALLAFVEGIDPQKKWRIEGVGDTLILYRYAKKTPAAEVQMFVDDTSSIAGGFFDLQRTP